MVISDFEFFSLKEMDILSQISYSKKIYCFLFSLNFEYPNFNEWYWSLYENNVLITDRDIIFYIFKDNIAGVAILKHNQDENKICTLRVSSAFQHIGIGSALIEKSFEILNYDRPLITIHISKYNNFKEIFRKYNFSLEQQIEGYYGFFKSELSYNGILAEKGIEKRSIFDTIAFSMEKKIFGYSLEKKVYAIPNMWIQKQLYDFE